ncbi:MAG: retropepsin-like aspartic protease family protein [Hyphomicrobium sp.]
MLAWLILLIAALSGALALFQSHADRLHSVPGLSVGIAILGGFSFIYVLTFTSSSNEPATARSRAVKAFALCAALAAAIPVLKSYPWLSFANAPESPPASTSAGRSNASVQIRRGEDGRFTGYGEVNGAPVRLLIDTGAAVVTLKSSDAESAGVDVSALSFNTPIETANGPAFLAPVRLRTVALGAIRLDDVEAFIAKPGSLNESLLGQSFLRRLTSYGVSGEFITLRQ